MIKIVGGYEYEKAKFLRTTCKECGTTLSRSLIVDGRKFCKRLCRIRYTRKHSKNRRAK